MPGFKMKPVNQQEVATIIKEPQTRSAASKGAALINEFKASKEMAAVVSLGSVKERNSISISATNWTRNIGANIWIRKLGGGSGTQLLLIDLDRADAATKKAYETRPRPGRKPKAS